MNLTPTQLDTLTAALGELDDFSPNGGVDTAYSGRAMYGRSCVALRVDGSLTGGLFRLGVTLAQHDPELAEELAGEELAYDQLGLGHVAYWPNVTGPAPGEED